MRRDPGLDRRAPARPDALLNGDGTDRARLLHIDNVVQANLLAATVEDPLALGQAYNIALGDQTSLLELYDMIRHPAGSPPAGGQRA